MQVSAQGSIKLLDILVFFALFNGGRKSLKTVERLFNSLKEATGPVESTSNWRHIVSNRSTLIYLLNEKTAFMEDVRNYFQVLFVELK